MATENKGVSGKWVVATLLVVAVILTALRFLLVPRTNPKQADPGSPYYSPDEDSGMPTNPATPPTSATPPPAPSK